MSSNDWFVRFSFVCGEVSAAPLAVCWGHLHVSRRGPVSALGQQHQRAARRHQWDFTPTAADSHANACCWSLEVTSLLLLSSASRPKSLLVYINPYGGKRQGKRIYEQKVAPLFAQAGISTDVIGTFMLLTSCSSAASIRDYTPNALHVCVVVVLVTEYANYARDHLRTEADLKKFDGSVSCDCSYITDHVRWTVKIKAPQRTQ